MVTVYSLVATVLPVCALVMERLVTAGISERHHSHHDTFTIASALTRALVIAMVFMGALGMALGWLCIAGALQANEHVVLAFFSSAVLVFFIAWAGIRRYKVSLFDDRVVLTPLLGRDRTVFYAEIDRMDWSGVRTAGGYRNLRIYADGRHVMTILGVVDLEQVLQRIDRFDVLGRTSEA